MAFDFAAVKSKSRRAVHDTLAVDALWTDNSVDDAEPVEIKARWHNKIDRFGDPQTLGFAEIIQGIDRIVLVPEDYPGVTFKRGDRIDFPAYSNAFILNLLEPADGPLLRIWQVALAS